MAQQAEQLKSIFNSSHFLSLSCQSLLSSPYTAPVSAPVLQTTWLLLGCSKLEGLGVTCSFPSPIGFKQTAKQQKWCCNTAALGFVQRKNRENNATVKHEQKYTPCRAAVQSYQQRNSKDTCTLIDTAPLQEVESWKSGEQKSCSFCQKDFSSKKPLDTKVFCSILPMWFTESILSSEKKRIREILWYSRGRDFKTEENIALTHAPGIC